ncbi:hypothetical protein TI39_contig4220g00011 [Zymoseptoria brevis]|uniref:nitrilase n=1 Tax=Zymoseptoria brevis TaxID=1047168 RepID=A0A0F4G9M6_9PEZI|nr:hypothetical protein TI39_contig4220g00011 [Zymoseptoria brevis]
MSVEGCRNQAQSYAIGSQAFVLHPTCVITSGGIELMKTKGAPIVGASIVGSSAVIGPDGRIPSCPETPNEQLIIADLDLNLVTKTKIFADAAGHYSRPDWMWLGVDKKKSVVRA